MKNTIINIGRQFGSGGKAVAVCIGQRMGIKVYDSELLDLASQRSGISRSCFERQDEKRSFLHIGGLFSSTRSGALSGSPLVDAELFRIQSETIRGIAQSESAVFVGRAADYVLRDMDCLDVFVCAPLQARVRRIAGRMGLSEDEARRRIEREDSAREKYYNCFTFEHWGVASNYDLCVDSSILGIEGTADFIIDFYRRKI